MTDVMNTTMPAEQQSPAPMQGAPVDQRQIGSHLNSIAAEGARTRSSNRLFTVVLFALISFSLLLIMLLGTSGYSSLVKNRDDSTRTRLLSTAIATDIHLEDQADSVGVMKGPEGDALTLTESTAQGNYQVRLYLSYGWLMKEYVAAEAPINPQSADKIVETKTFTFSLKENLLTFVTDEGENRVYLRSTQANPSVKGGE